MPFTVRFVKAFTSSADSQPRTRPRSTDKSGLVVGYRPIVFLHVHLTNDG